MLGNTAQSENLSRLLQPDHDLKVGPEAPNPNTLAIFC